MGKERKIILLILLVFMLVLAPLTLAHISEEVEGVHNDSEEGSLAIPSNIQKMIDYESDQAKFYLKNLSFIIAFLAGILGILTPCSLAILPAFFAYSFKEKKQITKMTFAFFLGFMPIFVAFGLLATFLGKSISLLQQNNNLLVIIAGVFIIILGLMVLFGKGFSGIKINKKTEKSTFGIFLFGVFFAIGFTACMGPILIGILLIAGVLQNYLYAGFLMVSYSLGLFVPLFLISMLSDKYNFAKSINKINNKIGFPLTKVISGALLIIMGLVFIIYGGTFIINNLGLGSLTVFIYSIQNKLVSLKFINIIGIVVLGGFLYLMWKFLRKKRKDEN